MSLRARLNLLPVKDTTYSKCHSQPESFGHVLNACTPSTGLMRECHNAILQHLVKAVNK